MSETIPSPAPALSALAGTELTYYGFTENERLKAMAVYLQTGSVTRAAEAINASKATVWHWVNDNDAVDEFQRIRSALRAGSAWDLVECSMLATKAIRERLVEGDPHVTKDGHIVYHPVKLRDATMAMAVSVDKAAQLVAMASAPALEVNGTLDKLAAALLSKVTELQGKQPEPIANPLAELAANVGGLMG